MQRLRSLIVASVAVLALVAACTKTESGTPLPGSSTTASAVASAPTPASATADVDAGAIAAKDAIDAMGANDAGRAGADSGGAASAAPAASGAAPAACGTRPLPDCPLQAWMKANVNPPVLASDTATLAIALDKIVPLAPAGYTNWASIAKDGAAAARSGDLPAAKASCRTCHDQYKAKYKAELRARKM